MEDGKKMESCVLCDEPILEDDDNNTVTLRQKGCDSINNSSQKRGDDICVIVGQKVHKTCRKTYVNEKYIDLKRKSAAVDVVTGRNLRSDAPAFIFKEHCLFCGKADKYDGKYKQNRFELIPVRTQK